MGLHQTRHLLDGTGSINLRHDQATRLSLDVHLFGQQHISGAVISGRSLWIADYVPISSIQNTAHRPQ